MKRYLFILTLVFGTLLFAESYQSMSGSDAVGVYRSYRPTMDDLYMRSYDLVLGQSAGSVVATTRSDEYKSQYEICDQDHNCVALTRQGETPQKVDGPTVQKHQDTTSAKAPFFVPVWQ